MEVPMIQLPPGDNGLIDKIVHQLKSQGIFDQFRKECIADVDTKPAYQNLRQRVEGSVSGFLAKQEWRPDLNKNQLRDSLRKHIHESGFLDIGVERIVDQVVNPKIYTVFLPQVEDVVYNFLGITKPRKGEDAEEQVESSVPVTEEPQKAEEEPDKKPSSSLNDLLPNDLDPISPESEENNGVTVKEERVDEEEASPPFERIENVGDKNSNDENSVDTMDSSWSKASGTSPPDGKEWDSGKSSQEERDGKGKEQGSRRSSQEDRDEVDSKNKKVMKKEEKKKTDRSRDDDRRSEKSKEDEKKSNRGKEEKYKAERRDDKRKLSESRDRGHESRKVDGNAEERRKHDKHRSEKSKTDREKMRNDRHDDKVVKIKTEKGDGEEKVRSEKHDYRVEKVKSEKHDNRVEKVKSEKHDERAERIKSDRHDKGRYDDSKHKSREKTRRDSEKDSRVGDKRKLDSPKHSKHKDDGKAKIDRNDHKIMKSNGQTKSEKDKKNDKEKSKEKQRVDDHKNERDKKYDDRRSDRDGHRDKERPDGERRDNSKSSTRGKDSRPSSSSQKHEKKDEKSRTSDTNSEKSKDSDKGDDGIQKDKEMGATRGKISSQPLKHRNSEDGKTGVNSGQYDSSFNSSGNLVLKIKRPRIASNIFEAKKIMQAKRNLDRLERKRDLAQRCENQRELRSTNRANSEENTRVSHEDEKKNSKPSTITRDKIGMVEKDLRGEVTSSLSNRRLLKPVHRPNELQIASEEESDLEYFDDFYGVKPYFVSYVERLEDSENLSEISSSSVCTDDLSDCDSTISLTGIEDISEDLEKRLTELRAVLTKPREGGEVMWHLSVSADESATWADKYEEPMSPEKQKEKEGEELMAAVGLQRTPPKLNGRTSPENGEKRESRRAWKPNPRYSTDEYSSVLPIDFGGHGQFADSTYVPGSNAYADITRISSKSNHNLRETLEVKISEPKIPCMLKDHNECDNEDSRHFAGGVIGECLPENNSLPTPENDIKEHEEESCKQGGSEEKKRGRGRPRKVTTTPPSAESFVMPLSPESDVSSASGEAGKRQHPQAKENQTGAQGIATNGEKLAEAPNNLLLRRDGENKHENASLQVISSRCLTEVLFSAEEPRAKPTRRRWADCSATKMPTCTSHGHSSLRGHDATEDASPRQTKK